MALLHNCNMLHNYNILYPGIVLFQSKTVFKKNFVFCLSTGYKLKKIVIPTLIRSFLYPRSKHEKGTNSKNGYFIDFLFLFQGTNCIKSYILHHFLQGTNFSQRSRAWISFFNFQFYVLNSITFSCLDVGRKDINML